jgi:hypothetical protein
LGMSKIFAIAVCALLLSLSSRLALADVQEALKQGDTAPTCAESDPEAGHRYKPGCKETIKRAGATSEMSYNSLGFRDKEYPAKPAKGWTRILLVGTSKMAGPGIAEKETPPRRLENHLRKSQKKLEVINAGVEGYMPLNQAVKLKSWLAANSPTHVLVQVELSSAQANDLLNAPYIEERDNGLVLNRRPLGQFKPLAFLLGLDTSNYQELRTLLTWQSGIHRAFRTHWCKLFGGDNLQKTVCLMAPTIRAIERMYKDVTGSGARFQLLISPGNFANDMLLSPAYDPVVAKRLDSITPKMTIAASDFKKIMDKRAIPTIFGPPLATSGSLLPGDYHFNATGAESYARSLAMKLGAFLEMDE